MSFKFHLSILLSFLLIFVLSAQEHSPIQNYTPEIYGAENQNWMISQDANRYIYVANNSGLLEYNGSEWVLYPSPNNTILRSVKVVKDRIYTGCYMEFGFWNKNQKNKLVYTSLVPLLKIKMIEDEQVWNIIKIDNWLIFQTLNRLYIFDTDTNSFKIISSDSVITKVFKIGHKIYYQEANVGLFTLSDGKPELVLKSDKIKNDIIIYIALDNQKTIYLTQNNGFYISKNGKTEKWILGNKNIKNISFYSCIQLKDKSFLLGSISQGLIHISVKGDIIDNYNQKEGLNNNTVLSLFQDIDGNIWTGLDIGINCINLSSPLKLYYDTEGLLGTVYASIIYKGNLYIGTNQGLFYKKLDVKDKFKFIEATNGQVWSLTIIDNTLFCNHNSGTFVIKNGKANLISNFSGTWQIKPIKNNKNLLIQGNYTGLSILEMKNNRWHFRNKISGFDNSVRFFEFDSKGNIWVNHEYKGVFKLTLDAGYRKYTKIYKNINLPKVPLGKYSSLIKFRDNIFYAYKGGLLKYDEKDTIFAKDSLFSKLLLSDDYLSGKIIVDNGKKLWAFSKKFINYISINQIDNRPKLTKIPFPQYFRKTKTGYENIINLKDNIYLIGTANGYIKMNISSITEPKYNISIDRAKIINKFNSVTYLDVHPKEKKDFNYKQRTFSFKYSVPNYSKFSLVMYQYKLIGNEYNNWSEWNTNSTILFENLPSGDYTFRVRALVGNKLTTNEASYSFTINKPWFLSIIAIAVYVTLLISIFYLINKAYKKYYHDQRQRLVEINKKKIESSQLESDKKIMALNNMQLRQDIENKNKELAISTMGLIKKNELLSSIKKELLIKDSKIDNTSVIKIIDKNLNNNNDWAFFQEAFNNADKDFLKKIKELHNDLTPNDLKFCAYLRLNLSSKEIAPLLNISTRSVEIKRYRLRKKMNLHHDISLVSYILDV